MCQSIYKLTGFYKLPKFTNWLGHYSSQYTNWLKFADNLFYIVLILKRKKWLCPNQRYTGTEDKQFLLKMRKNLEVCLCKICSWRLPVPTRVLNQKACEIKGRRPGGGYGGHSPHQKNFLEKVWEFYKLSVSPSGNLSKKNWQIQSIYKLTKIFRQFVNWPIETGILQIAYNFQSIHKLPDITNWR